MHKIGKVDIQTILGIITIILIIGGTTIMWNISKEDTILKRDGEVLAIQKWHVESERTFINKNTWYKENIMCPRIISDGGYETTSRCYYAPNTYEQLSRSIINTNLFSTNEGKVTRDTPYYAYGSRGSYAGILQEEWLFKDTDDEEDFPKHYEANWIPRDTRNYKLVWRIWNLKYQPLSDGNYTQCRYTSKNVKINLGSACDQLERAEVEGNKIRFYFTPQRGEQLLEPNIVDPASTVTLVLQHNGTNYTGDIDVETGTEWTAIAHVDPINLTVCISADHPNIGINASCGVGNTSYNFTVISGINTFNDSTTEKNLTFTGSENQSVKLKSIRNDSEIDSAKLTIFGYISGADYVKDFEIDFNNNSLSIQAFKGELKGSLIETTEFQDGTTSWLGGYNGSGVKTAIVTLPNDFNVTNASMDLTGSQTDVFDIKRIYLITDADGYYYRPFAPKCVNDVGTNYLYCFAGQCTDNVAICPGTFNSTVRVTIGASFGAAVSKTSVPYDAGVGACAVSGGSSYAYILGGYDGSNYYDEVKRYQYSNDVWVNRVVIPEPKAYHQCVYHSENLLIYIFGGYTTGGVADKTGYAYNRTSNTWSAALADMPDGVELGWLENYNSTHLISFGGTRNGAESGGRTYLYNIAADSWTTLDYLPSFLYANSGANVDGEIYAYGGYENPNVYNRNVYHYNETADNWDTMTTEMEANMYYEYCNEIEDHIVCHGSGGFGIGSQNRQYFHLPREVSVQVDNVLSQAYQGTTDMTSTTVSTDDFSSVINSALGSCRADSKGLCNLTMYIGNTGAGDITVDDLEINTTPGTINLGAANVTCGTTTCNPIVRVESEEAGILKLRNINVTYDGTGNFTWNASTVGNATHTANSTTDIWTIYYSKFLRTIPYTWTDTLFLVPKTYNILNVSFFGQDDTTPIMNITSQAQDKTFNFSIRLNESTNACLTIKTSKNNLVSAATEINTTWQYFNQIATGASQTYWMWGDLNNCNASEQRYYKPDVEWEACCDTCQGCP